MTNTPNQQNHTTPKRKKIFFLHGFQLRFVSLVAGSLLILLLFAGFHAIFVANTTLSPESLEQFRPTLVGSTWRLFIVGIMYIGVVTLAAIFLSHRIVGPAQRLEDEIIKMAESQSSQEPLHVREGDEFEGLVGAINKLVKQVKGTKKS